MTAPERHRVLVAAQGEALAVRIILEELRAGRVANALELLEQQLDTSLLTIQSLARDAELADREQSENSLRIVREYRQRHPRKN